jgi:hypothetical protein
MYAAPSTNTKRLASSRPRLLLIAQPSTQCQHCAHQFKSTHGNAWKWKRMRRWYLVHYDIMNDTRLVRGKLWSGSLRLFLYRIGLAKEAFDATAVHSHACDAPPKQMPTFQARGARPSHAANLLANAPGGPTDSGSAHELRRARWARDVCLHGHVRILAPLKLRVLHSAC